jgi:hypothetical protein
LVPWGIYFAIFRVDGFFANKENCFTEINNANIETTARAALAPKAS